MHAITILHHILSASLPEIHAKRLTSLLAAVEAVVSGSRLTLSDMGAWAVRPCRRQAQHQAHRPPAWQRFAAL